MRILTTIHRCEGINLHGKTMHRTAVRGVIPRGQSLLMVYSARVGDYKFPGGGVQTGETHAQTLEREIREECGAGLACIEGGIGAVIEYNLAAESGFDAFKMTSHYYHCCVTDDLGAQRLDDYEQDLGFRPAWIELGEAIRINKTLLAATRRPEWLVREIFVLEYLQRHDMRPAPVTYNTHG